MKKYIFGLLLTIAAPFTGFSQEISYGLKGGINYTMGGEITGIDSGHDYWNGTAEGEGGIGFHGGAFVQVNWGNFFIRPEVVYSSLEQEFAIPLREENTVFSVETFTVPLLVGYNIFGPLDIYAGPVYSNIVNDPRIFGDEAEQTIVVQNTPINAQIGAKVEFGRFGIDLRYEHSLSSAEQQEIDFRNSDFGGPEGGANRATFNDSRLSQLILSVTFKIGGPGLNVRRSRPCY